MESRTLPRTLSRTWSPALTRTLQSEVVGVRAWPRSLSESWLRGTNKKKVEMVEVIELCMYRVITCSILVGIRQYRLIWVSNRTRPELLPDAVFAYENSSNAVETPIKQKSQRYLSSTIPFPSSLALESPIFLRFGPLTLGSSSDISFIALARTPV
jgi:hypothetical protein